MILRVFPRRTSWTPDDDLVWIGEPGLFPIDADEVHVSVTFSWDVDRSRRIADAWSRRGFDVKIGGPAISPPTDTFTPGRYVRPGVTFTTRGCPNHCPFCLVPDREGPLVELPIQPGHEIADNNIIAASNDHFAKVCKMLESQPRAARFIGGLEAKLLSHFHVDLLTKIRVSELFFACDFDHQLPHIQRAASLLRPHFAQRYLRCYTLCGFNSQTPDQAEARLNAILSAGMQPMAMLYQPPTGTKIRYPKPWNSLIRTWSRPALIAHKSP